MINFSIIIPNYNGEDFLPKCLDSISIAIDNCPKSKFEIILIDNGSTDNSITTFSNFTLNSRVISLSKNQGFAKAVNIGIKKSIHNFVVVCNNDLTLEPNWFKNIRKTITQFPKAACYCGTVFNHNQIESQGISFDFSGKCIQLNNGLIDNSNFINHKSYPVWGSSAALVVYKRSILKKLNYFHEIYFAYLEDVDLAFRLAKNNYTTIINPSCTCLHLGGGTTNKIPHFRQYMIFRNWFIFIFLNFTFRQIITNLPQIIVERLRNFSYLIKSLIK